jgi:hypothetical protein
MVATRALLLEKIFTQSELLALDARLPGWKEIMSPKKKQFNLEASKDEVEPFNNS